MRCLGRTTISNRCKHQPVNWYWPICRRHKWQPLILIFLTIPSITGDYLGFYNSFKDKPDHAELIQLLDERAQEIDAFLKHSMERCEDKNYVKNTQAFLVKFKSLHKKNLQALKEDKLILSHEIIRQIHGLGIPYSKTCGFVKVNYMVSPSEEELKRNLKRAMRILFERYELPDELVPPQ